MFVGQEDKIILRQAEAGFFLKSFVTDAGVDEDFVIFVLDCVGVAFAAGGVDLDLKHTVTTPTLCRSKKFVGIVRKYINYRDLLHRA